MTVIRSWSCAGRGLTLQAALPLLGDRGLTRTRFGRFWLQERPGLLPVLQPSWHPAPRGVVGGAKVWEPALFTVEFRPAAVGHSHKPDTQPHFSKETFPALNSLSSKQKDPHLRALGCGWGLQPSPLPPSCSAGDLVTAFQPLLESPTWCRVPSLPGSHDWLAWLISLSCVPALNLYDRYLHVFPFFLCHTGSSSRARILPCLPRMIPAT